MVWIGLMWLKIGTSGGFLWTRQWTFGFHKMLVCSWVAAQLAASREGLSSLSEWGTIGGLLLCTLMKLSSSIEVDYFFFLPVYLLSASQEELGPSESVFSDTVMMKFKWVSVEFNGLWFLSRWCLISESNRGITLCEVAFITTLFNLYDATSAWGSSEADLSSIPGEFI
jgi:hypothetical protein